MLRLFRPRKPQKWIVLCIISANNGNASRNVCVDKRARCGENMRFIMQHSCQICTNIYYMEAHKHPRSSNQLIWNCKLSLVCFTVSSRIVVSRVFIPIMKRRGQYRVGQQPLIGSLPQNYVIDQTEFW